MNLPKPLKFIFLLLLTVVFSFSCKKVNVETVVAGDSKVKYVNTLTVEHAQNVSVDDILVSTIPLNFEENTDYIKIKSGNRNVAFWSDGGLKTQNMLNFTSSISYSAFLIANKSGIREILNYEDNLSNAEMDKAKIRFINLTPAFVSGINVYVLGGTQFVNGLVYKEASTYFSIDPTLNLRFNVLGSSVIKTIPLNAFQAGKIYNIWFSGTNTADLEAHVLLNN